MYLEDVIHGKSCIPNQWEKILYFLNGIDSWHPGRKKVKLLSHTLYRINKIIF